jgi:hypothetical protein
VVVRIDGGVARAGLSTVLPGAPAVAEQARSGRRFAPFVRPAVVNGSAGALVVAGGRLLSVMAFTVPDGRIVAIDALHDPDRLAELELAVLGGAR